MLNNESTGEWYLKIPRVKRAGKGLLCVPQHYPHGYLVDTETETETEYRKTRISPLFCVSCGVP